MRRQLVHGDDCLNGVADLGRVTALLAFLLFTSDLRLWGADTDRLDDGGPAEWFDGEPVGVERRVDEIGHDCASAVCEHFDRGWLDQDAERDMVR